MGAFGGEWLVLALSAILIVTVPLLVGRIVLQAFRKIVSEDRRNFEEKVIPKLEDLAASQTEIMRLLEDLSKR